MGAKQGHFPYPFHLPQNMHLVDMRTLCKYLHELALKDNDNKGRISSDNRSYAFEMDWCLPLNVNQACWQKGQWP